MVAIKKTAIIEIETRAVLKRDPERENAVSMSKFNGYVVDSSIIAILTLFQDMSSY